MAETDSIPCCAHCGEQIVLKITRLGVPAIRRVKFCAKPCAWAWHAKRRDREAIRQRLRSAPTCSIAGCTAPGITRTWCSIHYSRWLRHGDPLRTNSGRRETKACAHCGKAMVLQPSIAARQNTCSRQCKAKQVAIGRGQTLRPPRDVTCHGCGTVRVRRVRADEAGRYCSRLCHTDTMARVAEESASLRAIGARDKARVDALAVRTRVLDEVRALRRIASANRIRPSYYQWEPQSRTCAVCHLTFTTTARWQRTCSDACQGEGRKRTERRGKGRRRARLYNAPYESIDPIAVFERDGWRCYICKQPTPRELRGTIHEMAPELEHVISLAQGGSHTWGNVKCACRGCNGGKGVQPLATFLVKRLVERTIRCVGEGYVVSSRVSAI